MNYTLCLIDWEKVVRVFSALLVPTIGVVTTYIAWQQHNTNRRQLRLALFDRRLKVFNSTVKLIATGLRRARVELDEIFAFLSETREHEFLFGADIAAYINDIYHKVVELQAQMFAPPEEAKKRTELLVWFNGQTDEAKKKFGKYMTFKEPE